MPPGVGRAVLPIIRIGKFMQLTYATLAAEHKSSGTASFLVRGNGRSERGLFARTTVNRRSQSDLLVIAGRSSGGPNKSYQRKQCRTLCS